MSFKYQVSATYKSTKIIIAGQTYDVKNGVLESKQDIYHILAPLGFTRIEPRKSTAVTKT